MPDDVPDESDALITDPGQIFCEEHWQEIVGQNPEPEDGASGLEATLMITQHALSDETFYEIAFRIKNGYPPNNIEEIPEKEQPGNIHINKALIECSPLCCYLGDKIFEKVKRMEPPEEMKE